MIDLFNESTILVFNEDNARSALKRRKRHPICVHGMGIEDRVGVKNGLMKHEKALLGKGRIFIRVPSHDTGECNRSQIEQSMEHSDPERATKSPGGIIRVRTVVIYEDMVVAAVNKQRAAEFSNSRRCLHPV
jgi:hypothetical protein